MNTANTYANPNTASHTAFRPDAHTTQKIKIPGRGGAIARLIVMYLCVVIGFVTGFGSLFTEDGSFGHVILSAIAGGNMLSLLGAWLWGIIKWFGFMVPKAFGWAKAVWNAWIPLTFFGVYLKCVAFIVILMLPISAGFSSYMPLFSLALKFAENELTLLPVMGLSLLTIAVIAVLTLLDVCKIRGASVVETVKQFISARKH